MSDASAGGEASSEQDQLTLTGLANVLLRQRLLILWSVVGMAALAVTFSLVTAAYVARASFAPVSQGAGIQGIARVAQSFGFDLGAAANTGPTLDFYVSVVESHQFLSDLLRSRFDSPLQPGRADSASATLLDLYGFGGDTSRPSMWRAIERLRRNITISSDPSAQLVSFSVRATEPDLAEQISRRLLNLVNVFNIQQMQTSAAMERKFVQARFEAAEYQLHSSEDTLRHFLERNRSVESSPRLQFEVQRLQRAITLHQQVFTTLVQALEQARIAEVRNTPVITVVDSPEGSAIRERHLVRNGGLGLILGLVIGIVAALGREHLRLEREENPTEYEEFLKLRRQSVRGLTRSRG